LNFATFAPLREIHPASGAGELLLRFALDDGERAFLFADGAYCAANFFNRKT
jgi:hypothetical protein